MNLDITARHAPVSDAVKEHVHERLQHVLRHENDVVSVHVILDHEKTRHTCEVVVHGRRLSATVHADAEDPSLAVDRCAEKLRHQLEHHHGRLQNRRRRSVELAQAEAEAAAITASLAAGDSAPEDGLTAAALARIVRERARPQVMRLAEAQSRLEGSDASVLVFRDDDTDEVCILYRRPDGALSLVETGSD